ncbi:MAG: hypothetical protein JXA67_01185 [Micromonosporaceae bacterium]|nr:hypothetical protein [Micromonosporaceae bacterium]
MRLFVCAMVAVLGIGMFAVAALAWDRRRDLLVLIGAGRVTGGQVAAGGQPAGDPVAGGQTGGATVAQQRDRRYVPHAVVAGAIVLGMIMLIASCAGLLRF